MEGQWILMDDRNSHLLNEMKYVQTYTNYIGTEKIVHTNESIEQLYFLIHRLCMHRNKKYPGAN